MHTNCHFPLYKDLHIAPLLFSRCDCDSNKHIAAFSPQKRLHSILESSNNLLERFKKRQEWFNNLLERFNSHLERFNSHLEWFNKRLEQLNKRLEWFNKPFEQLNSLVERFDKWAYLKFVFLIFTLIKNEKNLFYAECNRRTCVMAQQFCCQATQLLRQVRHWQRRHEQSNRWCRFVCLMGTISEPVSGISEKVDSVSDWIKQWHC